LTWSADYVIGSAAGGTCPPDKQIVFMGRSFVFTNMVWFCDVLTSYVRPLVLILCTMAAIFIVSGAAGGRPEGN
jgi:hypothetical protein